MILFSHPTGNENVREAARALNESGLLYEFWTSVSWNEGHPLNHILPRSVSRELGRRSFSHIGPQQVRCYPWLELGRLAARQLKLSHPVRHEYGRFSLDAVYRSLDLRVSARVKTGSPSIQGVYAYEDGALAIFREATHRGMKAIYELPIGYWKSYRELMKEESSLQPAWAPTMQGRTDSDEKLRRKDEELALATDIIVPSEFVRGTLRQAGRLGARITVLPYGAPPRHGAYPEKSASQTKLKVLFVGALSQRKGLSYLLQAVTSFGARVELTIIGKRIAPCRPLDAALGQHRWIPSLPHNALLEEMTRHDVMVFPSLFEGCALVVLEAMSQGLPVITTPNTGAGHYICSGEDGFIVPIRDVGAIVEKLELLFDRDRLVAMSDAAVRKASQHSWEQYRQRLAASVRQAISRESAIIPLAAQSLPLEMSPSC